MSVSYGVEGVDFKMKQGGCFQVLKLGDKSEHEKTCEFQPWVCPSCSCSMRLRDVPYHASRCATSLHMSGTQELVQSLNVEISRLRQVNQTLNKDVHEERNKAERMRRRMDLTSNQSMESTSKRTPVLRQDFAYTRFNVRELCQFLCLHMDDLVSVVGNRMHRLFDCINVISKDVKIAWPDNPKMLKVEFDMLLSIVLAMPCWTEKQRSRFADFKLLTI